MSLADIDPEELKRMESDSYEMPGYDKRSIDEIRKKIQNNLDTLMLYALVY